MRGGGDGSAGAETRSSNSAAFHIIVLVSVDAVFDINIYWVLDLCASHITDSHGLCIACDERCYRTLDPCLGYALQSSCRVHFRLTPSILLSGLARPLLLCLGICDYLLTFAS